jgi:hypothetical protein
MSQVPRHMACKICRDKKVRCGGEQVSRTERIAIMDQEVLIIEQQPSCGKCLRTGEECVYVPISVPTRAALASMVKELQERLGKSAAVFIFSNPLPAFAA